ncbi:hypothetical protein F5882DRAFT_489506 [Hyaloscypha sp. PMI_1271]|nr:hypothetical protein F5882DRAFT_489506 [Hyaloscypha sp. PMI_1271]
MLSKYQEVKDLKVVPLLIGGTRSTTTGRTFPAFSNALQRELFLVESANPTSATAAAKAVSKAFKTWKHTHTHTHTRRDIFLHTANILKNREDDLKEMMRAETSCTAFFAAFQIECATSCIQEIASGISSTVGEVFNVASPDTMGFIFREDPLPPIGQSLVLVYRGSRFLDQFCRLRLGMPLSFSLGDRWHRLLVLAAAWFSKLPNFLPRLTTCLLKLSLRPVYQVVQSMSYRRAEIKRLL